MNGEFWKEHICERIREVGNQSYEDGFNDTAREKEYIRMNECPRNERKFCRWKCGRRRAEGGCLPVRGSERMTLNYEDDKCMYGLVETEKHVLFECTLYGEER